MNIVCRVIAKYPANRQFVVRYSTSVLSEQTLASTLDSSTGLPAELDSDGTPLHCRTDRLIQFPIGIPVTQDVEDRLIRENAPWKWLEDEERAIQAKTVPDQAISDIQSKIEGMNTATRNFEVAGTPIETAETLLAKDLLKIDADVDAINMKAAGLRIEEYRMAEAAAQAYKDAGYSGAVSNMISVWTTKNNKGLTTHAQAADDILAQAAAWRGALEVMRVQRLTRKKDRVDNVPNTMAQWNGFIAALRAQLFPNG